MEGNTGRRKIAQFSTPLKKVEGKLTYKGGKWCFRCRIFMCLSYLYPVSWLFFVPFFKPQTNFSLPQWWNWNFFQNIQQWISPLMLIWLNSHQWPLIKILIIAIVVWITRTRQQLRHNPWCSLIHQLSHPRHRLCRPIRRQPTRSVLRKALRRRKTLR